MKVICGTNGIKIVSNMEEKEIWKYINEYPNYKVSNLGRVKSLNYKNTGKEKIMKPCKNSCGYLHVHLSKNGKNKVIKVHRLVADAFLPNPDNLPQVNHKDENPLNNNFENLEWVTAKQNVNHGTRNKRAGESISKAMRNNKKNSKPVICLETGIIYPSSREVQRLFGFDHSHICDCCKGKQNTCGDFHWRYVD